MCRRTTCKSCGKPTWSGCGAHVEQVLGDVPEAQRCHCRDAAKAPGSFKVTPKAAPAETPSRNKFTAWLRK